MPGGAPEGNNNSAKGKRFHKAVERILARKYGDVDKGYEALAKIYVETAESGNEKVLLDVIDRSDGKAHQSIDQTTNHSGEIVSRVKLVAME